MIGGVGFALMAWREARRRKAPRDRGDGPAERYCAERYGIDAYPASAEYYRIIDNAWSQWLDGHQPIDRIYL